MLEANIESIQSRDDFVAFVDKLIKSLKESPEEWENNDLPAFLEAMSAWISDMDGYFSNIGEPTPNPDWRVFAQIIAAAQVYE